MTYYDAEIEYLESTSTQWIDTDIIPNATTGFEIKVVCSNNNDTYFIGLRNNSNNTRWSAGHSSGSFYWGYGNYQSSGRLSGASATIKLNYLNDKKYVATNGSNTVDVLLPTLSFTPAYNIRLFGSAGVVASYSKWSGKIYYCQITQGSELIMNLIPVRIGSVGYMYDKVSDTLFGNAGTGSFVLGPDVAGWPGVTGKPKVSSIRRLMILLMPRIDYSKYAIHKKINPAVMAIVYAQGWAANEDYMTFEEAAAVTDIGTVFQGKNDIVSLDELKYFTGLTTIANLAFFSDGDRLLKYITIPLNVTSIGSNAPFGRRSGIERITWNTSNVRNPNSYFASMNFYGSAFVEFASDNDFYSCINGYLCSADGTILYGVPLNAAYNIPSSVEKLGSSAFSGYMHTDNIKLSSKINEIGESCFNSASFQTVDLSDTNITTLPKQVFQGFGGKTIVLPATLQSFPAFLFVYNSKVTSLIFNSVSVPTLASGNASNITQKTPISEGNGYVYVPDASLNAYKTAWSAIESQIKPISEYNGDYQI